MSKAFTGMTATDPALILSGIHPQIGGDDRDLELLGQEDRGEGRSGPEVEDPGTALEGEHVGEGLHEPQRVFSTTHIQTAPAIDDGVGGVDIVSGDAAPRRARPKRGTHEYAIQQLHPLAAPPRAFPPRPEWVLGWHRAPLVWQ